MPRRTVRLYVLLARDAPVAVVFRRGPSKQVALVKWSLNGDRFEVGQWLKARIYERRCDLSPKGDKLVYFAAKWKGEHHSWTAVSKPPWLKALALWSKGDAWGGGGLFESDKALALNHPSTQMTLAGGSVPKKLVVSQHAIAGRGEDWPIYSTRMARDGWTMKQQGTEIANKHGGTMMFEYRPAMVIAKRSPTHPKRELEMVIRGISKTNGPWYVIDHAITGEDHDLTGSDWADWDRNGDLLYARDGCLYRLPPKGPARELIDLAPLTFEAREAPASAGFWK